jgi:4-amino-4-deoxy-L-arabinose transferase-like glycosyltransferase
MTFAPSQRASTAFCILFLLWMAIFGPGLFRPSLFDDADSAHAEAAREILLRHDWVTLHENGIRYLEKAPLPYWGMAAAFRLFGFTEFSARLPLALCVLILLFLICQFGRKFLTAEAGFWAAVVFLTSFGPYLFTRILIPDVAVGLWIAVTLYFFFSGWQQSHPSLLSCWAVAATVALNVLTKGLIGLVFPGAIIFVFLLLVRDLRHLLKMRLVSSSLVFLAIAAPWHILAARYNPPQGVAKGFLWFYFVNEHFLRYIGKRYPVDYGTVPLLLFWGLLLVWCMPWSAFFPQALAQIRMRLPRVSGSRQSPEAVSLLLFSWAAVILLFFSFSTRQEYYLAPALPALALLIGNWLAREAQSAPGSALSRSGQISASVLLVFGLLVSATALTLALISKSAPAGTGLADLLAKNPGAYVLSLGHFLDLTGKAMSLFRWPLIGTGSAFCLGPLLNWLLRRRDSPRLANGALVLMMILFIECTHAALGVFAPVLGSKPLAVAIKQVYQPSELIVSDGEYSLTSSINFYTGIQEFILNGRINGLWYGSLFPDAPPIFLDDEQFARLWAADKRVYLVTASQDRRAYLTKIAPAFELARAGGKYVFTNRP